MYRALKLGEAIFEDHVSAGFVADETDRCAFEGRLGAAICDIQYAAEEARSRRSGRCPLLPVPAPLMMASPASTHAVGVNFTPRIGASPCPGPSKERTPKPR